MAGAIRQKPVVSIPSALDRRQTPDTFGRAFRPCIFFPHVSRSDATGLPPATFSIRKFYNRQERISYHEGNKEDW